MVERRPSLRAGKEIGPPTSHQFVRDQLRAGIVRGEFASGERLIQNELADRYGVSTTPVREAMRDLATEGIIEFDARRGAVVRSVETAEFDEVYEMRLVLEPLAARRGVDRISSEQLIQAEQIQKLADAERDAGRWVEFNRGFHAILVDAANAPRLAAVLQQLRDISSLYVGYVLRTAPALIDEANREHWQLLKAYQVGDAVAAESVVRTHLESTRHAGSSALPEKPRDVAAASTTPAKGTDS